MNGLRFILINIFCRHARDLRFTCSRLALLSVLRSWAGTIEFCDPNKPSGLKAIVDILYLNQLEVRVNTCRLFFSVSLFDLIVDY